MDDGLFIQIDYRISEILRVSQLVKDFGKRYQIPQATIQVLDLALDEILNNIINYGFVQDTIHSITIKLNKSETQLILIIEDDGPEFNPLTIPSADTTSGLEERPLGGLGIHLTKNFIDHIYYKYEKNKNRLTLKQKIRGK